MPNIIFVQPDGSRATLAVRDDMSLMAAATNKGLDGMVGECGGNAMCATCHVIIGADQMALLPPLSDDEDALLDGTATPREAGSRLGCQIFATPALEGLVVQLPARQI